MDHHGLQVAVIARRHSELHGHWPMAQIGHGGGGPMTKDRPAPAREQSGNVATSRREALVSDSENA